MNTELVQELQEVVESIDAVLERAKEWAAPWRGAAATLHMAAELDVGSGVVTLEKGREQLRLSLRQLEEMMDVGSGEETTREVLRGLSLEGNRMAVKALWLAK